jgi:hypothetical protein
MEPAATPGSGDRPGIASLPMYDWPEIRVPTDSLWTAIHAELIRKGIDAPASLTRNGNPETLWTAPDLVLSQTCGFPYANGLSGKVALIGTPAYRIDGATPGTYFSVLVARRPRPPENLDALRDMRLAFNMAHSQSGFAAPVRFLAHHGFISKPEPLETGAHRASIQAVAAGTADWAAIDAVAWELALRHEPSGGRSHGFRQNAGNARIAVDFKHAHGSSGSEDCRRGRRRDQTARHFYRRIAVAVRSGPLKAAGLRTAGSTSAHPGSPAGLQAEVSLGPVASALGKLELDAAVGGPGFVAVAIGDRLKLAKAGGHQTVGRHTIGDQIFDNRRRTRRRQLPVVRIAAGPDNGTLSVWPSTRSTQLISSGISRESSLIASASFAICS